MKICGIDYKDKRYYGMVSKLCKKNNISFNRYLRILQRNENDPVTQILRREYIETAGEYERIYNRFIKIKPYLSYKEFSLIYSEVAEMHGVTVHNVAVSVRKYNSLKYARDVVQIYDKILKNNNLNGSAFDADRVDNFNQSNIEAENENQY